MSSMTLPVGHPSDRRERTASPRRLVMCRPDFFEVSYSINPWMDPAEPVDRGRAIDQWEGLRETYLDFGHTVDTVPAVPGLPDMVFAANAGIIFGDKAIAARFTHPERHGETAAYASWFRSTCGGPVIEAADTNEGEGDFLRVGNLMLAGTGFRTSVDAHHEVRQFFGLPVISLELIDPRFYHLDTALAVLDSATVAYYPPAFSATSNALLRQLFPDAILATDADAIVFGLNAFCDGLNVFLTAAATDLHAALRDRGYNPVGIELSELLKAGGSVKCCTLEVHS